MCNHSNRSVLRDREFDSEVRAAIESPQVSQAASQAVNYIPPQAAQAKTNCAELHRQAQARVAEGRPNDETPEPQVDIAAGAPEALRQILSAPDEETQQKIANEYLDTLLTPFYLGRGQFNHVSFLQGLEKSKGAPLTPGEGTLYGRIVGRWSADKAFAEFEAAIARGDDAEANAILQLALAAVR